MESRKPQEPSKSSRSKGRSARRQPHDQHLALQGQALTPGQLHLLRELIAENADSLVAEVRERGGQPEFQLISPVPNMLAYIHYELEKLRQDQDLMMRAWRDQSAR